MPLPCCWTVPEPEITAGNASESLRLKMSVPELVTAPWPSEPVVPPSPTWSVPPELIEVVPV